MKVGVWFYGVGTVFTGILDIAWRAFDAAHQPIKALGDVPAEAILACVAGAWMVAAGLAVLWRRSARIGAAAAGIAYLMFVAFWLIRYYSATHALGWRIDVLLGISFGLGQELMLVAPAAILYAYRTSADSRLRARATVAARWMLGLPPIVFGFLHIIGFRGFAKIVPGWMGFGEFWAVVTGIAFLLAGVAICAGKKDVLASRLLALMLLLFEGFVEIPPIFVRVHHQPTWGAAAYNLPAIGACLIFAAFVGNRGYRQGAYPMEKAPVPQRDPVVA